MRIVRLVSELDFGGLEKVVELASLELHQRADVELSVVVLSKGGRTSDFLSTYGIKVIVLNQNCRIPNFGLLFRLFNLFKELQPDVLHTSGAEANFHGLIAGFLAEIKVRIGEEIGFPKHHFIWQLLFKCTYLFADIVIVISQAVQKFIVEKGEVPLSKSIVIYNPVQGFFIPETDLMKEKFTFITVARLVPIKNINGLLLAFSQLETGNSSLIIVGDGSSRDSLYQLAVDLGISSKVQFVGFQSDVGPYLAKADCFVLPSFSEGSSVSLAEAMMTGLPSIVTKIGGASEILGKANCGILIDPYNVLELRNAMKYMIGLGYKEWHEMGKRARDQVTNKFSPAKHVDQLQAVYGQLLDAKD